MSTTTETRTEKGVSLARGPALILGTILLAAGLYFLYKQHMFPKLSNFPNGNAAVDGKVFLGIFGANGWTGMLSAIAGGLLLFGAAQHLLAKAMSLIVGVALGAAAIFAAISGNVLGLAAANSWTEIAWGGVAAILLFNTVIPRRRKTVTTGSGYSEAATTEAEPTRVREGAVEPTRRAEPATEPMTTPSAEPPTEPMTTRSTEPATEPMTNRTTDPATEPMTNRTTDPATEPMTTPSAEPASEPANATEDETVGAREGRTTP